MFPGGESIAGESAAKAGVLVGIFHPTLEPRLAGGSCEILDDNHSKHDKGWRPRGVMVSEGSFPQRGPIEK